MGTPENGQELEVRQDEPSEKKGGKPEKGEENPEVVAGGDQLDQGNDNTLVSVTTEVRTAANVAAGVKAAVRGASPLTDGLYHCAGSNRNAFGAGRDTMFPAPDDAA